MSGAPDPLYVLARTALLDALDALGSQRDAVVLVGAQAIYLHTGASELAVPEYTTDADIAIDPRALQPEPELEAALTSAGFGRGPRVGAWVITKQLHRRPVNVEIDLMVPEALGGGGRRAARLSGHADQVARKARGMEAALVDRSTRTLGALEADDARTFSIMVAGPGALMVSKIHKIAERIAENRAARADDKDALDVLRLLQAIETAHLASLLKACADDSMSGQVTLEALNSLRDLFGDRRARGTAMAVRAATPLADADVIATSCALLSTDLLSAIRL